MAQRSGDAGVQAFAQSVELALGQAYSDDLGRRKGHGAGNGV
ncbi:MAG TPA: hypothetical protein VGO28_10725 [Acidimicrobiia bacterium]